MSRNEFSRWAAGTEPDTLALANAWGGVMGQAAEVSIYRICIG